MTTEEKRIKIAEACGKQPWLKCGEHSEVGIDRAIAGNSGSLICPWCKSQLALGDCPDYLNDLNAMHEAERQAIRDTASWDAYIKHLNEVTRSPMWSHRLVIGAKAEERAEAFGRTLNLW